MNIRKATTNDVNTLVSLWKEMMDFHIKVDDYFTVNSKAEEEYRQYATRNVLDDNRLVLVCIDSDQIVGYIHAEIQSLPPIYLESKFIEIMEIGVRTASRRKGIGKLLLDAVLAWTKQQGLHRVECSVALRNPISQGFWKKNGFRGYVERCVSDI